jgi:hypothetical protein
VFDLDGFDGLDVQYYDHETWRDETVLAKLPAQSGNNPRKFEMRGVTSRTKAIVLGQYLWASEFYNRETIDFATTHAGFISTYGDLVKVHTDILRWGQGGEVLEIEFSHTLTLSEPPVFTTGDHQITLRTKTGGVYGPFLVEAVPGEDHQVKLISGILDETDIPTGDTIENPHYVFGKTDDDGQLCRIIKMAPQGLDNIKITAVVENPERFSYDGTVPPPIEYPDLAPFPPLPTIENILALVNSVDPLLVDLTWDASTSPTADSYVIDTGIDGIEWPNNYGSLTNAITVDTVGAGLEMFVRIAGVNADGQGNYSYANGIPNISGIITDQDDNLLTDQDGNILGY